MSWKRRKLNVCEEYVGDVFFGNDDHSELNNYMYKEDVIESVRRERELKELRKREKKRRSSYFGQCFDFFALLRALFHL